MLRMWSNQDLALISMCLLSLTIPVQGEDQDVYYKLTLRSIYNYVPEYADATSAQFWREKSRSEVQINHIMEPAFGNKFVSMSIVGLRPKVNENENDDTFIDTYIRINSPLDAREDLTEKIKLIMKNHAWVGDTLKFKAVTEIADLPCTVDGATHKNGDTYKTDTCIRCFCKDGQTKCMNMDCSDVWITEDCTSDTCHMKYAECKKGVCTCSRDHDYFSAQANCTEGVDLGQPCISHVQCRTKDSKTECDDETKTCKCSFDYTRREGEQYCAADLRRFCIFSRDCRQSNTKCVGQFSFDKKCACDDEKSYEKNGECPPKEQAGTTCTTTNTCAKHSECISEECQCKQDTSPVDGFCHFERHLGEVCEVNEDCRDNNTHCTYPKTCVCDYGYDLNTEFNNCTKEKGYVPTDWAEWNRKYDEEHPPGLSTGLIAIIIVSVTGGLIIIATPIIWKYRKNQQRRANRAV